MTGGGTGTSDRPRIVETKPRARRVRDVIVGGRPSTGRHGNAHAAVVDSENAWAPPRRRCASRPPPRGTDVKRGGSEAPAQNCQGPKSSVAISDTACRLLPATTKMKGKSCITFSRNSWTGGRFRLAVWSERTVQSFEKHKPSIQYII